MKNILPCFIIFLFLSCGEKNEKELEGSLDHAVLVYMVADNNLTAYAIKNIVNMQKSWNNLYNGKIVVFLDPPSGINKDTPKLMEIIWSKQDTIASRIIKSYPDINSLKVENMQMVINDFLEAYPTEKYSLIFWSHGSGWYPSASFTYMQKRTLSMVPVKSFGDDGNYNMNIPDLAEAIPDKVFTNIIFDACLMAGVETAYALKNKAEMIIASPAEVIAEGFPYATLIPLFFNPKYNAVAYAEAYFDDYNRRTGAWKSATVSVVKTSELDSLANITNSILKQTDISNLNKSKLQNFDNGMFYNDYIFVDFEDFISQVYQGELLNEFNTQLNKAILYSAYTDTPFLGVPNYLIRISCGLTCYIPSTNSNLNKFYKKFEWYTASGFSTLAH